MTLKDKYKNHLSAFRDKVKSKKGIEQKLMNKKLQNKDTPRDDVFVRGTGAPIVGIVNPSTHQFSGCMGTVVDGV